MGSMVASPNCTKTLIEPFEGCELKSYRDANGVLTIGWGYAGPDVTVGEMWTQQQADSHLATSLLGYEATVNKMVTAALNQNQFDALISLVYNIGPGHFAQSTVLRKLNGKDYAGAADAFLMWVQPGSANTKGLMRRRTAERALFLTPMAIAPVIAAAAVSV